MNQQAVEIEENSDDKSMDQENEDSEKKGPNETSGLLQE